MYLSPGLVAISTFLFFFIWVGNLDFFWGGENWEISELGDWTGLSLKREKAKGQVFGKQESRDVRDARCAGCSVVPLGSRSGQEMRYKLVGFVICAGH